MGEGTYRVWKMSMLIWIVAGLVGVVLAVVGAVFGESEVIGKVILVAAGGGIGVICASATIVQCVSRYQVLRGVRRVISMGPGKSWYFRIEGGLKDGAWEHFYEYAGGKSFDHQMTELARGVAFALSREAPRVSLRGFDPYVFTTLMPEGTVGAYGFLGWRKSRGVAKGRWTDVEYVPDKIADTLSLVRHELAHALLMAAYPTMTAAKQHELMKKANVS